MCVTPVTGAVMIGLSQDQGGGCEAAAGGVPAAGGGTARRPRRSRDRRRPL